MNDLDPESLGLSELGITGVAVFSTPMTTRFRGIDVREGMLFKGSAGWGEWSPFLDYHGAEIVPWLNSALEAAIHPFPATVRSQVPVNVTVPAVNAEGAYEIVANSGCSTAKVKVAESGQTEQDDLSRCEAVRDALGPAGKLRVDANGAWDADEAQVRLKQLAVFDLDYAEQPCPDVEDLRALRLALARAGVDVRIAADESIRRSGDPERVRDLDAADVAIIKVQPLGGVRTCLELAQRLGMPVVVSSALETSVGLAAGVALAAALPTLDGACGLNTSRLLTDDVVTDRLAAVNGQIDVRAIWPKQLDRLQADDQTTERWTIRLREALRLRERVKP